MQNQDNIFFKDLNLHPTLLTTLDQISYKVPSSIQAQIIPHVLERKDVIGQAQTGTGKTAAFALPILSNIDVKQKHIQALILAPTRELVTQVADAFNVYAKNLSQIKTCAIYGGQDYNRQLKALKQNPQIIVATPGRLIDHMKRKTIKLNNLSCFVLDEADEMLKMGFIEDVEFVLENLPNDRQIALFSATMPTRIANIANNYLIDPVHIKIKAKQSTATSVDQYYLQIKASFKQRALVRILETEDTEGVIIFTKTRSLTVSIAEMLQKNNFQAEALNGDLNQSQREKILERMRQNKLSILVATDVAARGIDIKHLSHVINYDVPFDVESYVHRIGRTGRAGNTGKAVLLIEASQRRYLKRIESQTKATLKLFTLPKKEVVNKKRIDKLLASLTIRQSENFTLYKESLLQYIEENEVSLIDLASTLALRAQPLFSGDDSFLQENSKRNNKDSSRKDRSRNESSRKDGFRKERSRNESSRKDNSRRDASKKDSSTQDSKVFKTNKNMELFHISQGAKDGIVKASLVDEIVSYSGLEKRDIGRIDLHDNEAFFELPKGMPKGMYKTLQNATINNKKLNFKRYF